MLIPFIIFINTLDHAAHTHIWSRYRHRPISIQHHLGKKSEWIIQYNNPATTYILHIVHIDNIQVHRHRVIELPLGLDNLATNANFIKFTEIINFQSFVAARVLSMRWFYNSIISALVRCLESLEYSGFKFCIAPKRLKLH